MIAICWVVLDAVGRAVEMEVRLRFRRDRILESVDSLL